MVFSIGSEAGLLSMLRNQTKLVVLALLVSMIKLCNLMGVFAYFCHEVSMQSYFLG